MIITTPIRPAPTGFSPIGSLSIVKFLRKHSIDTEFYNIDAKRRIVDQDLDVYSAQNDGMEPLRGGR